MAEATPFFERLLPGHDEEFQLTVALLATAVATNR
jgi:hypothetical protein